MPRLTEEQLEARRAETRRVEDLAVAACKERGLDPYSTYREEHGRIGMSCLMWVQVATEMKLWSYQQ